MPAQTSTTHEHRFRHALGIAHIRRRYALTLAAVTAAAVIFPLILVFVFSDGDGATVQEFLAAFAANIASEMGDEIGLAALAGALIAGALIVFEVHRRTLAAAHLVISDHGIRCRPPQRNLLNRRLPTGAAWEAGWRGIQRAVLLAPAGNSGHPLNAGEYRLQLVTDTGTHELAPFLWLDRDGPDHRFALREIQPRLIDVLHPGRVGHFRQLEPETLRRRVHEAPVVRALEAHGVTIEEGTRAPTSVERTIARIGGGYNLFAHKGLTIQLVIATMAGLYAVGDGLVLRPFQALEPLPWLLVAASAAVALPTILATGRSAPRLERSVVGVLCAGALLGSAQPALLRINALTMEQPVAVDYRMAAPGVFEPPADSDLPPIHLKHIDIEAYWRSLEGGTQSFRLQRGAAGFWQLDLHHFFTHTRAFYKARETAGAGD